MKCPTCNQRLNPLFLATDLPAASCSSCHGHWIQGQDYQYWLENLRETETEAKLPNAELCRLEPVDARKAKLCPACFRILRRYEVGKGTNVALDRCVSCGGIWFDNNEWLILLGKNLHDCLDEILSASYQRFLRETERRKAMEQVFIQRFGAPDYAELRRIRIWLESHPKRDEFLAYLTDPDPTKA